MEDQNVFVNAGSARRMLLTQKLASYLITHSGNYRYNSTESALLTHQEKILNKLRIGASNNEIAPFVVYPAKIRLKRIFIIFSREIAVKTGHKRFPGQTITSGDKASVIYAGLWRQNFCSPQDHAVEVEVRDC